METRLAESIRNTPQGVTADAILRACVHCGFCNATCPTYRLLGDELDGPRGRIYQIKQVLEGARPTRRTQLHLDRCLTCRNCETTCPSGVEFGRLLEIGRALVHEQVRRPFAERALHWLLREGLTRRSLFGGAVRLGRAVRWVLPAPLRGPLGRRRPAGAWPSRAQTRRVLLPAGCVQPALVPAIDAATARVLDALGIESRLEPRSGCCGALRAHLDDTAGALANARRNIDAWWPHFAESSVEALVINATACAATVRDYGRLLRDEPAYAARAERISAATRELGAFLALEASRLAPLAHPGAPARVAFHRPCTLQHALRAGNEIERLLETLGAQLLPVAESHMCCGSAGTYSLLQPRLSRTLRAAKLENLEAERPEMILSANIGCIAHLGAASSVPVWHWIEWVEERLR